MAVLSSGEMWLPQKTRKPECSKGSAGVLDAFLELLKSPPIIPGC